MPGHRPRVVVLGGGIAGLTAAALLQKRGCRVTLLERGGSAGGKIHSISSEAGPIDAGPTVLTMRWIFDLVFADAGVRFSDAVRLRSAELVARHAWDDGSRLDLFRDPERSVDAVSAFAGPREANGYRRFLDYAADIYTHAHQTFITSPSPSLWAMARHGGLGAIRAVRHIDPLRRMATSLGRFFSDPRLIQLFSRYATYYGASPFLAPATLNLIAHVEQAGVWLPVDGMGSLPSALARIFESADGELRLRQGAAEICSAGRRVTGVILDDGETIRADAVIYGGDVAALAAGALGEASRRAVPSVSRKRRSLSALTVATALKTDGFPLRSHNVFFHTTPYHEEFADIYGRGRLPVHPTVYVRAQDRDGVDTCPDRTERLFWIINAPPTGDSEPLSDKEIDTCLSSAISLLQRCGLTLELKNAPLSRTAPSDWEERFPHTGGGLYGQATHSPWAALRRAGVRSKLPGLYLAGGSVHPGAGVPMAALSGRLSASALLSDFGMTALPPPTDTAGGTSTA